MNLIARITALSQSVGADIKRIGKALDRLLPPQLATLSMALKAATIGISADKLTATFGSGQAVSLGDSYAIDQSLYFEVTFVSGLNSGNCSVGVTQGNEFLNSQVGYNGIAEAAAIFQNSGNTYSGGTVFAYGDSFRNNGDIVRVALSATTRLVWFSVNGGLWNGSASANPSTGAGGVAIPGSSPLRSSICTDTASSFTINYGVTPFIYVPPPQFEPWASIAGGRGW